MYFVTFPATYVLDVDVFSAYSYAYARFQIHVGAGIHRVAYFVRLRYFPKIHLVVGTRFDRRVRFNRLRSRLPDLNNTSTMLISVEVTVPIDLCYEV